MVWAYGIENDGEEIVRNNQPLFKIIHDKEIDDDHVFLDKDSLLEKDELIFLLTEIGRGDELFIRSYEDLGDSFEGLINVLSILSDKEVFIHSAVEDYIPDRAYYKVIDGVSNLINELTFRKRVANYRRALGVGKVGRPKSKSVFTYINEYREGRMSKKQVLEVAGISESTFYRYLYESKEKDDMFGDVCS